MQHERSRAEAEVGTRDVLVVVGRPTFDLASAQPMIDAAVGHVDPTTVVAADGAVLASVEDVEAALRDVDPAARRLIVLFASFADSRLAAAAVDHFDQISDLVLWSLPETWNGGRLLRNSLCGANLAAYRFVRDGRRVISLHEVPGPASVQHIELGAARATDRAAVESGVVRDDRAPHPSERVADIVRTVRETSVGVIGDPPDGFEPCLVDPERLPPGVTVTSVAIDEMFDAAERPLSVVDGDEVSALRDLPGNEDLSRTSVEQAVSLERGVERMAEREGWNAVAIRCWPECFAHGGAVCASMAMMNELGLPAACEADALGALTMRTAQAAAGGPAFLADLVDADVETDRLVFWHCGVAPPSLAADPTEARLGRHPNREVPLVFDFGLAPGPVTIARWSQGPASLRLVVGEAEIVGDKPFRGTSCVVQLSTSAQSFLTAVFEVGLEHHVTLVPGHHQRLLEEVAAELGVPVVRLTGPALEPARDRAGD